MERILSLEEQIRKFFFEKHLNFLTSVPQRRTQEIILASCAKGNSGKMTDYAEVFETKYSSMMHFKDKLRLFFLKHKMYAAAVCLISAYFRILPLKSFQNTYQ